jgi:hypothetical protein
MFPVGNLLCCVGKSYPNFESCTVPVFEMCQACDTPVTSRLGQVLGHEMPFMQPFSMAVLISRSRDTTNGIRWCGQSAIYHFLGLMVIAAPALCPVHAPGDTARS